MIENRNANASPGDDKRTKKNKFESVEKLSRKMAGRHYVLNTKYKTDTLVLMALLKLKGQNCFDEIVEKAEKVNSSTGELRNYYRTLTAAVPVDVIINRDEVTKIVCDARSRFGLERFKGNIHSQCVEELHKIFVLYSVYKPGRNGKNERAFIPKFALLSE